MPAPPPESDEATVSARAGNALDRVPTVGNASGVLSGSDGAGGVAGMNAPY
jgi:hypothetical protein